MTQKQEDTQAAPEVLEIGSAIIQELSSVKPLTSLSFILGNDGYKAIEDIKKITEDRMGKKMPKLKQSALESLSYLLEYPPGSPININFTEDELKALNKVADLIDN